MPNSTPAYRRKSGRHAAVVTLRDARTGHRRDYGLGGYGSPESRERYHRLIAQWEAAGRRLPGAEPQGEPAGTTINELLLAYWRAEAPHLSPSHKCNARMAFRILREHHGTRGVDEFGPAALKRVRQHMVTLGWSRAYINRQVARIKELYRWGVEEELAPEGAYAALLLVRGLRRGKAPDHPKVLPAPMHLVEAATAHLPPPVRAMVQLQLITGARPSEVCAMRAIDIDTSGAVWVWKPPHKNEWRGMEREIYLGARAQDVIRPWLAAQVHGYLFSPAVRPGAGSRYTTRSYGRAITRGCDRAFPAPDGRPVEAWRRDHRFTAYQLRHRAATDIRREFGLEAAQLALGHASAKVTDAVYAERDSSRLVEIARKIG